MPKAFIVYSSNRHVPYMNEVLDIVKLILIEMNITPHFLNDGYFSGVRFIHQMLNRHVNDNDFAIIILDGLRPNVAYEFGLFQMRGIDIIPIKRNGAKFAIKSAYNNDSSKAFGDWRFKRRAFEILNEPSLEINELFSDLQGMEEIRFDTIDDTEEENSLGYKLRERIENIIPNLISKEGPSFTDISLLFPDFDQNILTETIRILSLFSILGLRRNYDEDSTFQQTRDFIGGLFIQNEVSMDYVLDVIEQMLKEDNIIRDYGRYITINSERLIRESFQFMIDNHDFIQYYLKIMESNNPNIIKRFLERLGSSDYLGNESIDMLGRYIFTRSNLFPNISILQDKASCELFATIAYIFTSEAVEKIKLWFNDIQPNQIETYFPFKITLHNPGRNEAPILWFLSKIAGIEQYFNISMKILYKFSLTVIINEDILRQFIHSGTGVLPLDRFLEQCYPLHENVKVFTRWRFISSINENSESSIEYQKASLELKFRALKNFLLQQWTVTGNYYKGSLEIRHFHIDNLEEYYNLELCRKKAFQILMDWVLNTGEIYQDDIKFFSYLINNLAKWLRYYNWDDIKDFLVDLFDKDIQYRNIFRAHISNLKKYDSWQGDYQSQILNQIINFDDEIEESLSDLQYIQKYLNFSKYDLIGTRIEDESEKISIIDNIRTKISTQITNASGEQLKLINNYLLNTNTHESFIFGSFFGNNFEIGALIEKINLYQSEIENSNLEHPSSFLCGLISNLYRRNNDLWEEKINELWKNPQFTNYRENLLWISSEITLFSWNKYIDLIENESILPNEIFSVLHNKQVNTSINIESIREVLRVCISQMTNNFDSKKFENDKKCFNDPLTNAIFQLEDIVKKYDGLLDTALSELILNEWSPFAHFILSRIHDTNFLIRLGLMLRTSFLDWLRAGFYMSELNGNSFLVNASEHFMPELYEIIFEIFSIPEGEEEITQIKEMSINFVISGECMILLNLSSEQLHKLYSLNSRKLGRLIGRILRRLNPNESFPDNIRSVIIQNHDNVDFKHEIFMKFIGGVRSFTGINYSQAYSGDFQRIINWCENANDRIFISWLQDLKSYVEADAQRYEQMWVEKEVR